MKFFEDEVRNVNHAKKQLTIIMLDLPRSNTKFHLSTLTEKIRYIKDKIEAVISGSEMEHNQKDINNTFLFICPENTFLNYKKKKHAYSKKKIVLIEKEFNEVITKYPNLIIIPGTITHSVKIEDDNKKNKHIPFLIMKRYILGYPLVRDIFTKIKEKNTKLHRIKSMIISKESIFTYNKRYPSADDEGDNKILFTGHKSSLFELDGVKFGIEICMDHGSGVLRKEQKDYINVHIVLSDIISKKDHHVANNCRNIIFINCALNFSNSQDYGGVWIGDDQGRMKKIDHSIIDGVWVYEPVPIPDFEMLPTFASLPMPKPVISPTEAKISDFFKQMSK